MNLAELFGPDGLVISFAPFDKWDAIEGLIRHVTDRGALEATQMEDALEAVMRRERSMSTGMEKGIAIPHAALAGIEQPVGCLGITRPNQGIPFESMDGAPAELIVLLLIPKAQKLLHIRTLADVARILGIEQVRQELGQAKDAKEALQVLDKAS